jgi:hypothetical protein
LIISKGFFLSHIGKILSYSSKLKYLNKKDLLSHIEKTKNNSCEHRVHILKGFKFHIVEIKHSSYIYIVNFEMS